MSLKQPVSQYPQFTLSQLSAPALVCLTLLSSAVQAASCDYRPEEPAEAQISQCQSAAQEASGSARAVVAKAAFDTGFKFETLKPEPNLELSSRFYQIAADLGSAGAQYNLANQIVRGGGDMSEAAEYYRMAAKQGAKLAQYNLGTMYLQGLGVAKDPQKAYLWFRTAAGLGLAAAQFQLAGLFEQGIGVEKNTPSAIGWYELAAEQGYTPAAERLSDLKKNLSAEPETEKGVLGGLLIPRAPRQTLSFSPAENLSVETTPDSTEQPVVSELNKTQSQLGSIVAGATGFVSRLIKPSAKLKAQPERSDQLDALAPEPTSLNQSSPEQIADNPRAAEALTPSSTAEQPVAEDPEADSSSLVGTRSDSLSATSSDQPEPITEEQAGFDQTLDAELPIQSASSDELPAPEILTSALPAAELPATTEPTELNQAPLTPDASISQAAPLNTADQPSQPSVQASTNSEEVSTATPISAQSALSANAPLPTPTAIEAPPEQLKAAAAQTPEQLDQILSNAPSYQVKRPEFPAEIAYLRAAESGNELAQLALANAYAQGKGVPADTEAAAKWYLRAARQGNAEASLNLALSYKLGNGLKKNHEQALKWFKHSAFRGNAQALYNLGAMYASGTGTQVNEALATRYFTQSANLGYEPAKNALAYLRR